MNGVRSLQSLRQIEVRERAPVVEDDSFSTLRDRRGRELRTAGKIPRHELLPNLTTPGLEIEAVHARGKLPLGGAKEERSPVGGETQRPVAGLEARNRARGTAIEGNEGGAVRTLCQDRRAVP